MRSKLVKVPDSLFDDFFGTCINLRLSSSEVLRRLVFLFVENVGLIQNRVCDYSTSISMIQKYPEFSEKSKINNK